LALFPETEQDQGRIPDGLNIGNRGRFRKLRRKRHLRRHRAPGRGPCILPTRPPGGGYTDQVGWSGGNHFRTFQVCPKDQPPKFRQAHDASNRLRWRLRPAKIRRRHPWEGAPMPSVRRRDFVALIGGAAVAWPLAARAEQPERLIRLGVLGPTLNNPPAIAQFQAFRTQLRELGFA